MRKIWAFLSYQNLQKFEKKIEKIRLGLFKGALDKCNTIPNFPLSKKKLGFLYH